MKLYLSNFVKSIGGPLKRGVGKYFRRHPPPPPHPHPIRRGGEVSVRREMSLATATSIDQHVDYIVCADLEALSFHTKWHSFLHGARLAQLAYIVSGGSKGACLNYNPVVSFSKKSVWTSAGWAEKHPALLAVLETAVALPCSKWSFFVGSNVEFVTRVMTQQKQQLLGLVTTSERRGFPQNFEPVFTANHFLAFISRLSLSRDQSRCG